MRNSDFCQGLQIKLPLQVIANYITNIITNWGTNYYKSGQLLLLQIGAELLQIRAAIKKWDIYYKPGRRCNANT